MIGRLATAGAAALVALAALLARDPAPPAGAVAPPPAADAERVVARVVTWNLEWYPGGRPGASDDEKRRQVSEVAAVVTRLAPDVLVLQEVASEAAVVDLLRAAGLPLEVHVVSAFREGGRTGAQQIAICSRYTAHAAWAAPWARGWAGAPRGYAYARLQVGERVVHAYGLHLKSNAGGDPAENASKREDAIEQVLRHVAAMTAEAGSDRVILAGDFNTSFEGAPLAGERTLKLPADAGFFWSFEGVPAADRVTVPAKGRYPDACFDHVFLRGLGRPVARVVADAAGSDHRPVVVEVALH